MQKIITGTAPERFTIEHLKGVGFTGSQDRGIVGLLKDLGFLTSDGTPTHRYHEYRNAAYSKKVLGEALKEAYQDLFHINERPTKADRTAIEGKFKTTHNVTDRVAEFQAATFFGLLDLADISEGPSVKTVMPKIPEDGKVDLPHEKPASVRETELNLRYNIEIHLPATKDIEVYNAIFKSLKGHLLD